MKENVKEFFRIWRWVLISLVGLGVIITTACVLGNLIAPGFFALLALLPGVIVPGGFALHTVCAEYYVKSFTVDPDSSVGYKKELRRLRKLRRTRVKKAWEYKGLSYTRDYLNDVAAVDRMIARHMGLDNPEK